MVPQQFVYNNTNSNGVFAFMRQTGAKFSLSSNDYYSTLDSYNYCDQHVVGRNVSCLVDGSMLTAWRNNLTQNNFFLIDFDFSHFLLKDYVLKKVCREIPKWKIEGSNDKMKWFIVDENGPMLQAENALSYHIKKPKHSYQYYKFSLISGEYIHLSLIEFFGILNPIMSITCVVKPRISYSLLFLFLNILK